MGLALRNEVFGNLSLGQQGIGGHILALQRDGFQQRDGHLDLVGAFDYFLVFYRQGADFFWA